MRLLKIVFAGALAALTISVVQAASGDFPHWKPSKKTIAKLDFAFRNAGGWHGAPPEVGKYNRFYAGVTIKGQRMVRAEFAKLSDPVDCIPGPPVRVCLPKLRKGAVHIVPENQFPSAKGGGCSFVNMLYDFDAERMVELECNAPE